MNIQTQHTKMDIAISLMQQQQEQAEVIYDEMAKTFWTMIGAANQCAFLAMDDAVEVMQQAGMFRQQVKRKAQQAISEYEKYEKSVYKHFTEQQDDRYYLWADMVSRAGEKMQSDMQKLYFSIKNVLDRYRVPKSDVHARIQAAMVMIDLACLMYDTMLQQFQRQTMIPLDYYFRRGRMTAAKNLWREVAHQTGRSILPHIDLNDDAACHTAIKVILERYKRAELLNEAAGEALKLNPECEKYITDKVQ